LILPAEFAEALGRAAPRLGGFAARILWYPEITSTNDVAMELADAGAPEGSVVLADAQTSGRGRLGRSWASPPGAGIYASVVLRPDAKVAPLLTLAAGLAVAEGIQAATALRVGVKWPNDVFVDHHAQPSAARKVAGILAEGSTAPGNRPSVVLGIGINVLPAAYPLEVAARATSLEAELGRAVDRGLVLAECLASLSARYADLAAARTAAIVGAWRARAAATFGRRVVWDADGERHGIAQDIDHEGRLLVKGESGVSRVISGEVRWI
jgi:BirA family biotin operon repressor/biotin-[acetyl-CoA-carboxylase] ligase